MYPNATHILQPLDVSVFGPLKKEWAKEVHQWRMGNNGMSLTKKDFAPMLENVINNRLKKETITHGFRACGLYPWSPDAIDYSKCRTVHNIINTSINANNDNNENKKNYSGHKYLELLLGDEKVSTFQDTEIKIIELDAEDIALYNLWIKSKELLKNTDSNNITVENENEPVRSPVIEIPENNFNENIVTETAENTTKMPLSTEKRQNDLAIAISPSDQGSSVPSPFKRNLLWPKSPQKTSKCRRRLRLPAVVTSKEFQNYEEKKMQKQKLADELKEDRQ